MPKKVSGIFNPFTKPKKIKRNPKSSLEEINETEGIVVEPTVTLDGDSYGLVFIGVERPEDAAIKLVNLIYAVNKNHEEELLRRGITVGRRAEHDEMMLEYEDKIISVFVGDDVQSEVPAYRRIAHALLNIQDKEILETYNVRPYERG